MKAWPVVLATVLIGAPPAAAHGALPPMSLPADVVVQISAAPITRAATAARARRSDCVYDPRRGLCGAG